MLTRALMIVLDGVSGFRIVAARSKRRSQVFCIASAVSAGLSR